MVPGDISLSLESQSNFSMVKTCYQNA